MRRLKDAARRRLVVLPAAARRRERAPERERIVPAGAPRAGRRARRRSRCSASRRVRGSRSSSSTPSTRCRHQTQFLGLALGLALVLFARRADRDGKQLVVTEEIEDDYPPDEHPEEQEMIVQIVDESGERLTRRRLFVARARRRPARRSGSPPSRPLASLGPVLEDHGVSPDAVAARAAPRRRGGPSLARRRHRGGRRSTPPSPRAPTREELGVADRPRAPAAGQLGLPREAEQLRGGRDRRVLEDLHPRGLRDLAVPRAALPADEPKPALVCPCHYSTFDPATAAR